VSFDGSTSGDGVDGNNPITGLLGSILGDSLATRKAKIEEASRNAHDVTGLVKKKKLESNEVSSQSDLGSKDNTKRKLDFSGQSETGIEKKARIENAEGG
jgi:HAT1-interacting factor 1